MKLSKLYTHSLTENGYKRDLAQPATKSLVFLVTYTDFSHIISVKFFFFQNIQGWVTSKLEKKRTVFYLEYTNNTVYLSL